MIDKENLIKSIKFFNDIELKNEDIKVIYKKFEKILEDPTIKELLHNKISFLNENSESKEKNIRALMEILVSKLDLEDLNVFLDKIIKDESLSDFLQDFFLEKLI
jgi:hypothetical protein